MYIINSQLLSCSGAPNDSFLSNTFKRCFRLSGVFILKLCRLILGCGKRILTVRLFLENLSILEFCPFTENLRSYRLSENDSFFGTQKTIRKQQTLNFSYHESSRWQSSEQNQRGLKAFRTDNLPKRSVGCPCCTLQPKNTCQINQIITVNSYMNAPISETFSSQKK